MTCAPAPCASRFIGVTSEEKLLSDENKITPDYYADAITDFYP